MNRNRHAPEESSQQWIVRGSGKYHTTQITGKLSTNCLEGGYLTPTNQLTTSAQWSAKETGDCKVSRLIYC